MDAGGISESISSSLESVKQLISLRLLKSTHPARPSDWLKSVPLLSHGMKFKYLYKHFYWLFCPACRILTTHTLRGKKIQTYKKFVQQSHPVRSTIGYLFNVLSASLDTGIDLYLNTADFIRWIIRVASWEQ